MAIIQGGSGFPFLAPPVYEYIVSGKCTGVAIETTDVPDQMLLITLQQVHLCLRHGLQLI